jgi:30S ribosomal protein S31
MGKGDKKTKKGKISAGSYGVLRKRKSNPTYVAKTPKVKKEAPATKDDSVKTETPAKKPTAKKTTTKKPTAKKTTAKKPTAKK